MKTSKYIMIACLVASALGFTACSDKDGDSYPGGNGPVTVTQVYLEDADATVPERVVDFARLGQTLRLEGSGFGGTKKVLVNGYDTYFNTALVTDNSMILQLLSNTPITDADESVRNKIIFVKDGGQYEYAFTIRAASPRINSISNCLPVAGDVVTVYGENLHETTEVTLPGGVTITDITNAPKDEEGEWFSFVMPDGISEGGSITMVGANGTAISAEYFNNTDCMILNFDGVGSQGYWSWSETGSMINNEDLVSDPLGKYGTVCQLIPERLLEAGIAAGKSRATEVWTAGNGNDFDDWSRMFDYIPATTPLTDIAFQFEIYVPDEWDNTGNIEVALINNYNFAGLGSDESKSSSAAVAFFCPWYTTGKAFKTTGWQTVTIPFSEFTEYKMMIENDKTPTFQDVYDKREGASYKNFGMSFVNNDIDDDHKSSVSRQKIYVDNWRIVPCKSSVVSDFPDE